MRHNGLSAFEKAKTMQKEIAEISTDEQLQKDMGILPPNYNFEIPKTIWKIRSTGSKYVCLQLPEGLLLYACFIADILKKYTAAEFVIMGDVTYGACCVGDQAARALGCDLMIHYGHSCLIPIQECEGIAMLYVFVTMDLSLGHFVDVLMSNFNKDAKIALVTTVQFVPSIKNAQQALLREGYNVVIPQVKPLSPGEVLGCTAPKLSNDTDIVVYLGDGRFHLESVMIQNSMVQAYQYNPYSRKLTSEEYDFTVMVNRRKDAIKQARRASVFGLIQGSLGRQGNPRIVEELERRLRERNKQLFRVLLSEITPAKLALFKNVDCWVQVACPRLSIDWGDAFDKPLLTPYEAVATLNFVAFPSNTYPMDYYADESLGPWTNRHESYRTNHAKRRHITIQPSD